MTRHLWITLILLGLAAGCGEQYANPRLPDTTSSVSNGAAGDLAPAVSKITLTPRALGFYYTGTPVTKRVIVAENGYTGKFLELNRCRSIASALPTRGQGPRLKVKITAKKFGSCLFGFVDAKNHVAFLPIVVTTPTPSPGPTPSVRGLYVAYYGSNAVIEVSSNGTLYCIPAKLTLANCAYGGFTNPSGVAVDSLGNVYVALYLSNAVEKVARDQTVTCVPPTITLANCYNQFMYADGIAVDAAGNLYVVGDGSVQKVTPTGTITTIYGGSAVAVAVDAAGDVYVANYNNSTVQEIATNGTTTTIGSGFSHPQGVAVDANGNVFVSDTSNNAVKEVAPNGTITCVPSTLTLANCGTAGFNQPMGVAVDSAGNVYVADYRNSAVKEIAPNGTITCVPSTLTLANCSQASFQYPIDVTLDANRDPL